MYLATFYRLEYRATVHMVVTAALISCIRWALTQPNLFVSPTMFCSTKMSTRLSLM